MPGAAPAGGGGGGGGQEEGSTGVLWAVAGLFVILGLLWYSFRDQIVFYYLTIKLYELDALSFFTHSTSIGQVRDLVDKARYTSLTFDDMLGIGQLVGTYIRIPFTILLSCLIFVVYFGNTTRIFKNTYSMNTLAQAEKGNWPQILPVMGLNLVKADIDTGPWAMAMTPIQFCKKFGLIEEYRRARTEGMSRKDAEKVEVMVKKGEANKIFAMQLGPRWEGVSRLPPYAKALFTVFAARINADTPPAMAILKQLNRSSVTTKFDFTGVDALLKKHEGTKLVQKIVQNHAYVLTVMAAMLGAARADGVQATADFLWLKPLDRRLWYVLNTMGRQTPFVESAGAYAHYLAEKEAGRKIIVPMIENATAALELAVKSMVYHPDEEK